MIRFIAAVDSKDGIANEKGIPWKIPTDTSYYKELIKDSIVVMGFNTYKTHETPLSSKTNYVLFDGQEKLRDGFEKTNLKDFIKNLTDDDVWIIGGAQAFETFMPIVEELYLTIVEGDFNCTKFLPEYKTKFWEAKHDTERFENDFKYFWTIWIRK